ncbi:MAG: hypothetical protein D6732_19525 [Methanobacteriota archaeon]|nr:MAG: hypothetical protein D6732_19525 [Euryarchaeota archaeon]
MTKEDVNNALQKLKLDFQSLESQANDFVSRYKIEIERFEEDLKALWENMETAQSELAANNEKIRELTQKSNELQKQRDELSTRLAKLQELSQTLKAEVDKKNSEKENLEREVMELERERGLLENDKTKLQSDLDKASADLLAAEDEHKARVKGIADELQATEEKISRMETQYKVLGVLLRDGYVKHPSYEVLKTLAEGKVSNSKQLAMASGVAQNTVDGVLMSLHDRGIIAFERPTGNFEIKRRLVI